MRDVTLVYSTHRDDGCDDAGELPTIYLNPPMHEITLICSGHLQIGACNASELFVILKAFEPDVIFTEMRPSEFDDYYARGSVEAHAIAKYRALRDAKDVPVDDYEMSQEQAVQLKSVLDRGFHAVRNASAEYQRLEDERDQYVCEHGFRYLNNDAFAQNEAKLIEIEETLIERMSDEVLKFARLEWRELMRTRERHMVANVYGYCRLNTFATGVFLVGAAHKSNVVKEIKKYASTYAARINWEFAFDGRRL